MVRRRSVESLINEIEQVKQRYQFNFIRFGDDVFVPSTYNEWLEDFVEQYASRIAIPFYCLIHPNMVSQKTVKALKQAGCHSVAISVESGNAELRKTVLGRPLSDEKLLEAYGILREHKISIFSNCMLGLPESTIKDDLLSLDITFKCKPTYASFTVFTPFPGTELYRLCLEKGYLSASFEDGQYPESTFQSSCLNTVSEEDKNIHHNILMLGALANWMPFFRKMIMRHWLYWKPNRLFNAIGFLVRNYLQSKIWAFKLNPIDFLRLSISVYLIDRKNYSDK